VVKGGVLGGSRGMIPMITRSLVGGKGRIVGVRKEDVAIGKPKVGNERLKGGSSERKLPERERTELVSLNKI